MNVKKHPALEEAPNAYEKLEDNLFIFTTLSISSQSITCFKQVFNTMGSYLTIVNDTEQQWMCKVGPDMVAITWGVVAAAVTVLVVATWGFTVGLVVANPLIGGVILGGATGLIGVGIQGAVQKVLDKRHYDIIHPGESKRYGKMTLSLWRQSECIRIRAQGDVAYWDHLMMRPIFSGATDKSTREYSIQKWADKHGIRTTAVTARKK